MNFKIYFIFYITILVLLSLNQMVYAQDNSKGFIIPRTNSKAIVHQTIASTQIIISYNRPNKRGREIFGKLIPFNEIWRTGADEATSIYFSTPVLLAGHPIDSGSYELFTIPDEKEWVIVLQQKKNQWGSYKFNQDNDVLRFAVAPRQIDETVETFTISVDNVGSDSGVLTISWDHVVVPIAMKINLMNTAIPMLEKSIKESSRPPYFQAAMFYFENNLDIDRAEVLMSMALKNNPEHIGMLYRYALILKRKGSLFKAIEASEKSLKGAQTAGPELKAEYTRLNTSLLNELNSMKD